MVKHNLSFNWNTIYIKFNDKNHTKASLSYRKYSLKIKQDLLNKRLKTNPEAEIPEFEITVEPLSLATLFQYRDGDNQQEISCSKLIRSVRSHKKKQDYTKHYKDL